MARGLRARVGGRAKFEVGSSKLEDGGMSVAGRAAELLAHSENTASWVDSVFWLAAAQG